MSCCGRYERDPEVRFVLMIIFFIRYNLGWPVRRKWNCLRVRVSVCVCAKKLWLTPTIYTISNHPVITGDRNDQSWFAILQWLVHTFFFVLTQFDNMHPLLRKVSEWTEEHSQSSFDWQHWSLCRSTPGVCGHMLACFPISINDLQSHNHSPILAYNSFAFISYVRFQYVFFSGEPNRSYLTFFYPRSW